MSLQEYERKFLNELVSTYKHLCPVEAMKIICDTLSNQYVKVYPKDLRKKLLDHKIEFNSHIKMVKE